MPNTVLGLDIGTQSLGWAIIDGEAGAVKVSGVRIFPEGVDREPSGAEKARNQARRIARSQRRTLRRRAFRKQMLRDALASLDLLPTDPRQLETVLRLDPYGLRARALTEPLSPHELGRVFLNLGQRRGFLSNRKTDAAEGAEHEGMLAEMAGLDSAIQETGCETLGAYLAARDAQYRSGAERGMPNIRRRHVLRSMLIHEFDCIWERQRPHHPELLTDRLKYGTSGAQTYPLRPEAVGSASLLERFGLHGIIFYQRKMYWPEAAIGTCDLEPGEARCPAADRMAQRFRIYQEVNNLRYVDPRTGDEHALAAEQRQTLYAYLETSRQRTFDQIRKKLQLSAGVRFNLERGDRGKLLGLQTDAILGAKRALGNRWKALDEETRDSVVAVLLGDLADQEALARLAGLGLDAEEAARVISVALPSGRAAFSKTAIVALLPHLKKGLPLMGRGPEDSAIHAAGYLRPDEQFRGRNTRLPPPPDLPNPIVRQALQEVRRVVNAIVREHGVPDRVHVELAREAKRSLPAREALRRDQRQREKERDEAKTRIEELALPATGAAIARYRLWREQHEDCPYCGGKMGIAQVFGGECDVDHILPRWRSLDSSMNNKVLCHRTCNQDKGDRTVREWLEETDPDRYARVLAATKSLPYPKQQRFRQRDIVLDDFVHRQLTDTAYISRETTAYIRTLGVDVVCVRGGMTAELRYLWGLNGLLSTDNQTKNRNDYRHHLVDAVVIALTDRSRLQALARARGSAATPWAELRAQVKQQLEAVVVSHRPTRRVSGALHEATIYGCTQKAEEARPQQDRPWARNWMEDRTTFVRRKPVSELRKVGELAKIRDHAIRDILKEHLKAQGISLDEKADIPRGALDGKKAPHMPGSGMPIRRVRMLEKGTPATYRPVSTRRPGQFVKLGGNHHIAYFEQETPRGPKWQAVVVTLWDAVHRVHAGLPLVERERPELGRFVMALCKNDMFAFTDADGVEQLAVVRKFDQTSRRIDYRIHTDGREDSDLRPENLYLSPERMRKAKARKIAIDAVGHVRRAGA